MIDPEDIVGPEWAEWYRMTPQERWSTSERLWAEYLTLGGTLAPEPDPQSPFYSEEEWRTFFDDGRPSLTITRRNGIRSWQ